MITAEKAHEILEELKERHRKASPGGCRLFSLGEDCRCTLCLCDDIHAFVDGRKSWVVLESGLSPKRAGGVVGVYSTAEQAEAVKKESPGTAVLSFKLDKTIPAERWVADH